MGIYKYVSSGEEIDYTKFIGKFYRTKTDEELAKEREIMEKKREERNRQDAISAQRYKERKEALRHKYSPIRHGLSKEEKEEFIQKSQK